MKKKAFEKKIVKRTRENVVSYKYFIILTNMR